MPEKLSLSESSDLWDSADRLQESGDLDGCVATLQTLAADGHPTVASQAALRLGDLEASRQAPDLARQWYEAAMTRGDDEIATGAVLSLYQLETEAGRVDEAEQVLWRAMPFRGHQAAMSMTILAVLLLERNDPEAAKAPLRRAATLDDPEFSPQSAAFLGSILAQQGNEWGASELFQRASSSEDSVAQNLATEGLRAIECGSGSP